MVLNKKGLSQIISTLLIILLTIAAGSAVFIAIKSFVNGQLEDTAACYDVYDQVSLNTLYTCYNSTANNTFISIDIKDINIDSLLVSTAYTSNSVKFELTNTATNIPNVLFYNGTNGNVKLPNKESGKTYVLNVTGIPEKIIIAPKISGKQCDVSSTISNMPTCA